MSFSKEWYYFNFGQDSQPNWDTLKDDIMDRSNPQKQASALYSLINLSRSEKIPANFLMLVIQYTGTTRDHNVIKLLLFFLESIEVRDSKGDVRPEFILITDAIRNLALHINEFVRILSLRFLYKVNDMYIIQNLFEAIIENLDHENANVRWTASVLISRLCRDIENFSSQVRNVILNKFKTEQNSLVLSALLRTMYEISSQSAVELAIDLSKNNDEDLKMTILNIALRSYKDFPDFRYHLLDIIISYCEDELIPVKLEAANILKTVSFSSAAVRTTISTYCELLGVITDDDQRAFVVQSLIELVDKCLKNNIRVDIGSHILNIAQGLNINGSLKNNLLDLLVQHVPKESAPQLVPLISNNDVGSISALNSLLYRFPELAGVISDSVAKYMTDQSPNVSTKTVLLLQECGFAGAGEKVYRYLSHHIEMLNISRNISIALWCIGEFAPDLEEASELLVSFFEETKGNVATIIKEDGTYDTVVSSADNKNIKYFVSRGDSHIVSCLVLALIKLKARGAKFEKFDTIISNLVYMESLEKNAKDMIGIWLESLRRQDYNFDKSLSIEMFNLRAKNYIESHGFKESSSKNLESNKNDIYSLSFPTLFNTAEFKEEDINKSTVLPTIQLTGPSDHLYIEVTITQRKFDRIFKYTLYNTTDTTLVNIYFEFFAVCSLTVVKKNEFLSLTPKTRTSFECTVLITSSRAGIICGNVTYSFPSSNESITLTLTPINVDFLDFFNGAEISNMEFRSKWFLAPFEKNITVSTLETDLYKYVSSLAGKGKFKIVTPLNFIEATVKTGFTVANLYTVSYFGDEVLANVSVKRTESKSIEGFVRIRSANTALVKAFEGVIS